MISYLDFLKSRAGVEFWQFFCIYHLDRFYGPYDCLLFLLLIRWTILNELKYWTAWCTASDPPSLSLHSRWAFGLMLCVHGGKRFSPHVRSSLGLQYRGSWGLILCVHGGRDFPSMWGPRWAFSKEARGASLKSQGVFLLLLIPEGSFLPSVFGGICWWSQLGLGLSLWWC